MPSIMMFRTALALFLIVAITACESADRGGVNVTPKPLPPVIEPIAEPKPLAILSAAAKCIEMDLNDYLLINPVSQIIAMDCLGDVVHQGWFLTPDQQILSTNGLCLTAGEPVEVGDPVQIMYTVVATQCHKSPEQRWRLDTNSIRNESIPNFCLDLWQGNIFGNFNAVRLAQCTGLVNQQWNITQLDPKHLINADHPELYINVESLSESGFLHISRIIPTSPSAKWLLEPVGPYFRIRNMRIPDQFLNLEHGYLESSTILYDWQSALWNIVRIENERDTTYFIRNVWLPEMFIGLDFELNLYADIFTDLAPGSARWKISSANR